MKNQTADSIDKTKNDVTAELNKVDKDDIREKLDKSENAIASFLNSVGSKVSCAGSSVASALGYTYACFTEELKNPVVVVQTIITGGAIAGGIYAYKERSRVKNIPEDVFYVYSTIVAGLVILDGFAFKKLYPKYK